MALQPTRVLIAMEHRLFRQALCQSLERHASVEVVGDAGQAMETIDLVARVPADVLLIDNCLADQSGLTSFGQVTTQGAPIRTILLADGTSRQKVVQAIRLGARGVVDKDVSVELLVRSINHVGSGGNWIGHEWIGDIVNVLKTGDAQSARRPSETLTIRETQIILAVLQGGTNKQVSRELGLSEQTVKNHLSNIFNKLGVDNRLELALYALSHDIVPPTSSQSVKQSA
jgi:two-component system, NarL family, nitrate/nitrite response regulator NarL